MHVFLGKKYYAFLRKGCDFLHCIVRSNKICTVELCLVITNLIVFLHCTLHMWWYQQSGIFYFYLSYYFMSWYKRQWILVILVCVCGVKLHNVTLSISMQKWSGFYERRIVSSKYPCSRLMTLYSILHYSKNANQSSSADYDWRWDDDGWAQGRNEQLFNWKINVCIKTYA